VRFDERLKQYQLSTPLVRSFLGFLIPTGIQNGTLLTLSRKKGNAIATKRPAFLRHMPLSSAAWAAIGASTGLIGQGKAIEAPAGTLLEFRLARSVAL
jgi:hypothetical protein